MRVVERVCFCTCVCICLSYRLSYLRDDTDNKHSEEIMQICTCISVRVCVCVCVFFILPLIKMANDDLSLMRSQFFLHFDKPKWLRQSCDLRSIKSHSSPLPYVWHHQQLLEGIRWLQLCQLRHTAWTIWVCVYSWVIRWRLWPSPAEYGSRPK